MAERTVNEGNLGAWLIKCDPKSKYDLPRAIKELDLEEVTNWSVADNYRSRMMKPEDKVILWVSGDSKLMTRGIWGVGWVTDFVRDTVHEDLEPDEDTYWHNEEDRLAVTNDVALDIPLFEGALSDAELRAADIDDLEVQVQAQGSNPSWVSKEQLARIEELLDEWPEWLEQDEVITISDDGAAHGDPEQNAIVEAAAVQAVIDYYGADWKCDDVGSQKVGWDLTFTHTISGTVAKVEVKGLSGDRPIVLLTANELRAAREEPEWYLAVVTRALSTAEVVEYTAAEAIAAAEPYVYRAAMPVP
ncbi:protein NO VEIN domain-containing protein [Nocardioides sp.]|uniref:protein NO VEIN domain-containing protein n=1 Tax=Nocardioides sp. TaxID=35761 RepID=UPI002715D9AE|nr:DUF3883 domain-containing protein [Nocardioides sp.]MDO9455262.1 DUF3883 domain-containing protein [Nocardioides sp.]